MVDLQACINGDARAWGAFVERFSRVIYAAVSRTLRHQPSLRDPSLIEDVAQDVFVRLVDQDFRLLKTYDPAKSAITTWLTIVARSVALDHARRKRLETVPLDEKLDGGRLAAGSEAVADDGDGVGAVGNLDIPSDLLTARQRLVLTLLFDKQMSVEQAAMTMGIDTQTIYSTRHKAIARLKEYFAGRTQ